MTPTGPRRLLFGALATILCLCVVALLCEALLWAVAPRDTYAAWRAASMSYVLDEDADWRCEPRRYPWGIVNRHGFRGPELPLARGDAPRIAVVGGSAVFDLWKRDAETWPAELERRLAAALGRPVEVLNAGTPGYSTWQAYRVLERKVMRWRPDLVVLYELFNDSTYFRLGSRAAIARHWRRNAEANYISAAAHPSRVLDALGLFAPRTVDFFRIRWVSAARAWRLSRLTRYPDLDGRAHPNALAFYEDTRARMARLLAPSGAKLAIVTQATLIRAENTALEGRAINLPARGMTHARLWQAYQDAWEIDRRLARRLPNAFLIEAHAQVPSTLEYFLDEVHLSHRGGARLAEIVAEGLLPHLRKGSRARGVEGPREDGNNGGTGSPLEPSAP